MEDKNKKLYESPKKQPENWDDLWCLYEQFHLQKDKIWVFRGAKSDPDPEGKVTGDVLQGAFESHLVEAFENFGVKDLRERRDIEAAMIKEFRRKAHLYGEQTLKRRLDCLALMRHHGAPTRMLDWTYSFFSAVYFAVNRCKNDSTRLVWALDSKWLNKVNEVFISDFTQKIKLKYEKKDIDIEEYKKEWPHHFANEVVNYLINENPKKMIYVTNPYFLNERLAIQRGVFLCQGDIEVSWGENLVEMLKNSENSEDKPLWKIKINLNKISQKDLLNRLYDMNISQASLFPDLDGFAESLRTRIVYPESLGVESTGS